jgi:hypothetical protein
MLADGDEAPAFAAPAALPDGDIETVTILIFSSVQP